MKQFGYLLRQLPGFVLGVAIGTVAVWLVRMPNAVPVPQDTGAQIDPPASSTWSVRLKDPNPARRLEAAESLAEMGEQAQPFVPDLVETLGDPEVLIRVQVLETLTRIGRPAVPALLDVLKGADGKKRRAAVLIALDLIVSGQASPAERKLPDEAVAPLMGLLKDEDPLVRALAARTLGFSPREDVTAAVIGALKAEDPLVRRYAAEGLGRTKSKQAVVPLASVLSEPDTLLRRAAIEALVHGPLTDGDRSPVLPELSAAAKDKDEAVRRSAATALGRIITVEPKAASPLVDALGDDREAVRDRAMSALAKGGEAVLPSLRGALQDKSIDHRKQVVETMALIGEPAVETLRAALRNDSVEVRLAALKGLLSIGRPSVMPALGDALADDDPGIGRLAAEALSRAETRLDPLIPALIRALKSKDDGIVCYAALLLARTGPTAREALPVLRELLKSKQAAVRETAAEAIKSIDR